MPRKPVVLLFLLFLKAFCSAGQAFRNLDFGQRCDTSRTGLCHWDLSWGGKEAIRPVKEKGKTCVLFQGNAENRVAFAEQAVGLDEAKPMRIITLSAMIKSVDVQGKGAGLNIGLYDKSGGLVATRDMGGYYSLDWIKGTTGWKAYSVSLVCPAGVSVVKIGMILFGKGRAWFRDCKVAMVPVENRLPSKLARGYIRAVCDTIRLHSLVRDSVNMPQLEATALKIAGNARQYSDCHLAVNFLLESLRPFGDEHSFLMKPAEVKNWEGEGSQVQKIEYAQSSLADSCGYILVPPFHGGNPRRMRDYADSIQAAIGRLTQVGIKGWIVDLRQNTGGNMAPMIAGLGPLFSAETLGSLVDVRGKKEVWHYARGRYYWDNDTGWRVSNPVVLPRRLPIAVLTGSQTGSSGEAVALSFVGNENTTSFGEPTWGLTTGNGSFRLADGAMVYLASTIMADRNGKQYRSRILPDYPIEKKPGTPNDEALFQALEWLKKRK